VDHANDIYHKEEPPLLIRRRKKALASLPEAPSSSATPDPHTDSPGMPGEGRWVRRSRRHRSHISSEQVRRMSFNSRLTWLSLSAVLVVYLAALGLSILRAKRSSAPQPPALAAPAVVAETATSAAPVAVVAREPVDERIRGWKSGERAMEDAARQQRDGHFDAARTGLEQALVQSPEDIRLRFALARLLMSMKEYELARGHLMHVVAADPAALEPRQALAETFSGLAWHEQARQVANWVLESDPYSPEAHRMAAQASLLLDDPEEAITHLRRLVNMNRENLWARSNLGLAYLKTGQIGDARKAYRDIIQDVPTDSAAYFNLAMCEARAGDAAKVVETLAGAASAFGDPFIHAWLSSPEFDGIRTAEVFAVFQNRINGVVAAGKTDAAVPPVAEGATTSP
jgi:tetratricopeptide (TPR) repeat protein